MIWPSVDEARAKCLEGMNKTSGSLNNVKKQFKQAPRQIAWDKSSDELGTDG